MKKNVLSSIMAIMICALGFSQVNYNDVGVIINDNGPVSLEIGEYFKQSRNIPEQNMIHIQTVTDEVIDTTEFRNIQYQIKNYILSQGLENDLLYLVTTKGVPFDIQVDSCTYPPPSTFSWCSSVESELTLLLSADSTNIIKKSMIFNPYYGDTSHYSRQNYDLLLVTRLDGYSKEDVFDLIDRTGPESYVNKQNGLFVFDISYTQDTNMINIFSGMMTPAIDSLNAAGWNTLFHPDYQLPSSQEHVIGFVGFMQQIIPHELAFSWEKGSFSELIVTGPDFTFYDSLNTTGNLILADLLNEGCGAASGFVHPTYASQISDYQVFFSRYTDERNNHYNLAESYYMATKTLSWMNILIGDPKTTITTQGGSSVENPENIAGFTLFPNPASDKVNIRFWIKNPGFVTISIIDQLGKIVKQETRLANTDRNEFALQTVNLPTGLYVVGVSFESGAPTYRKIMVTN